MNLMQDIDSGGREGGIWEIFAVNLKGERDLQTLSRPLEIMDQLIVIIIKNEDELKHGI